MSGRRGGCSLARCPLSLSPQSSPHPHPIRSFPAPEALRLQAGPRRPSAPFPSFPSPQASGPGPQFPPPRSLSIPAPPYPTPPHLHPRPSLRTRNPGPGPIPAPHPPTRPGSHLRGSSAAAQKAALLQLGSGCCSRLLLLLLLLLSSPRCPRPDPGRCHRRGSSGVRVHGCQSQLPPRDPRPRAPCPLGLNSCSFQGPRPWPPGTDTP